MLARTLIALTLHCSRLTAGVIFLGPTPYLSSADSPFDLSSNFYLEDFEDGELNTPGIVGEVRIRPSLPTVDSVDADDGVIDGFGFDGHSALPRDVFCTGPTCYAVSDFDFNTNAFGRLPNAVGVVWTDGYPDDQFVMEIYDSTGQFADRYLLSGLGDPLVGSIEGSTAEDRFIGAIYGPGIGHLTIMQYGPRGYLEFDHLQYGVLVPEPSAGWLLGICLGAILCRWGLRA